MATINGYTAEHMAAIEAACIVSGAIDLGHLILTKQDGSTIDAGDVSSSATDSAIGTLIGTSGSASQLAVDARFTADDSSIAGAITAMTAAITALQADSGWITCTLATNITGTAKVRLKRGNEVFGQLALGYSPGTLPTTQTSLFTLPSTTYAPISPCRLALGGGSSNTGSIAINTAGAVTAVSFWANGAVSAGLYYDGLLWCND